MRYSIIIANANSRGQDLIWISKKIVKKRVKFLFFYKIYINFLKFLLGFFNLAPTLYYPLSKDLNDYSLLKKNGILTGEIKFDDGGVSFIGEESLFKADLNSRINFFGDFSFV